MYICIQILLLNAHSDLTMSHSAYISTNTSGRATNKNIQVAGQRTETCSLLAIQQFFYRKVLYQDNLWQIHAEFVTVTQNKELPQKFTYRKKTHVCTF
jgi:hypothetical protein